MTRQQYDNRIDALNRQSDRIFKAFIISGKSLSPKAQNRLADIFMVRDELVRGEGRKFRVVEEVEA